MRLHDAVNDVAVEVTPRRLLIAGFTGRDEQGVRRHVEELEAIGVSVPDELPAYYPLDASLLVAAGSEALSVRSEAVTGEVEPVLVKADHGGWYLGIGSDLTDRDLERTSIPGSKACVKPVGVDVWPLEDVIDRWDDLRIQAFEAHEDEGTLTQDGTLGELLPAVAILERGGIEPGSVHAGTIVFCGTVPRTAPHAFAPRFRGHLIDDDTGRSLRLTYEVRASSIHQRSGGSR
jgi:uncharacterized protein DUF2848